MELRPFGATNLRVSQFGLGCARIGGIFQATPESYLELIDAAVGEGINFFDTADMYSQGESEKLLGRGLKGKRGQVIIASKAGYKLPAQRRLAAMVKPILRPVIRALGIDREKLKAAVGGQPSQDFSEAYLRRAVEGSLKRLRTDYLDVFQLHSPDAAAIQRQEWRPAVEALQKAGKIRCWGIACDRAPDAVLALQQPGVASVQVTVNLVAPQAEETVLPVAREKRVAIIAREILGNGILVKDPASLDLLKICQSPEEAAQRKIQLAEIAARAQAKGMKVPRMALEHVRDLPGVSVALIGARTKEQLLQNLLLFR
jgi:aryl-alcohol dehydrogenase-like predicted oxidoreductase